MSRSRLPVRTWTLASTVGHRIRDRSVCASVRKLWLVAQLNPTALNVEVVQGEPQKARYEDCSPWEREYFGVQFESEERKWIIDVS